MKKVIKLIVALCLLGAIFCGAEAFAQEIKINVNGSIIETDVAPVMENDRVLVPVRAIAESLKCDVSWDEETQAVSVFNGMELVVMWIDRDMAFKTDGASLTGNYKMDVPPKTINDRTMIPVRAISELLGAKVDWIDGENTVTVEYTTLMDEAIDGVIEQLNPLYIKGLSQMYDVYYDYVTDKQKISLAVIEMMDGSQITVQLYNEIAPETVKNFTSLANSGAFNGKVFHRVIKDFMIQGGGYDENGVKAEYPSIKGEFISNNHLNFIPHNSGVISMARTNDPNSASNEFFIVHMDSPHLDGFYAGFGFVVTGMDVVNRIANIPTDENDKPVEAQVIKSVTVY